MFSADYHCHSDLSPDASDTPLSLLRRAEELGLTELCITDHCDIGFKNAESRFDSEHFWNVMRATRNAWKGKTVFRIGLELGQGHHDPKTAEEILQFGRFDFVIGSIHSVRGLGDDGFYHTRYTSVEQCLKLFEQYLQEMIEMVEWGKFDVVGHIGYPLRYMIERDGIVLPAMIDLYRPLFSFLFNRMVEKGIGLEMNLSNYKDPRFTPGSGSALRLVKFYRECGGEIITLGSDAHSAARIGYLQEEGKEFLRTAGFKYLSAFRKQEVRFEPL